MWPLTATRFAGSLQNVERAAHINGEHCVEIFTLPAAIENSIHDSGAVSPRRRWAASPLGFLKETADVGRIGDVCLAPKERAPAVPNNFCDHLSSLFAVAGIVDDDRKAVARQP